MKIENLVLSPEQCKELVAIGIDMSDASFVWYPKNGKQHVSTYIDFFEYDKTLCEEIEVIPTYTFQDIFDRLPSIIEWKGKKYRLGIFVNALENLTMAYRDETNWCLIAQEASINGAYNIIKWVAESKLM